MEVLGVVFNKIDNRGRVQKECVDLADRVIN